MADFPNLNMSIGDYYKMLVEGKRPTRQRTHKDEPVVKAPVIQQKIIKVKKPERKEEQKHQQLADDDDSSEEVSAPNAPDKIQKRRDKLMKKQKIAFQKTTQRPVLASRQLTELEEDILKIKQSSLPISTELKEKPRSHKKQLKSVSGGTVLKITNPLLPKKKTPTPVAAPAKVKEEIILAIPHPAKEEDQHENQDKLTLDAAKANAVPAIPEVTMYDRFEIVSPHPYYVIGRYLILKQKNGQNGGTELVQIISYDNSIFTVESTVDKKTTTFDVTWEDISFYLGKSFFCNKSVLKNYQQDSHLRDQGNSKAQLMVAQAVKPNEQGKTLNFVTLAFKDDKLIVKEVELKDQHLVINESSATAYSVVHDYSQEKIAEFKKENRHENNEKLLAFGQQLQQAYTDYIGHISTVALTQQNINELMFAVCTFDSIHDVAEGVKANSKQRKGIFLRAKLDSYYQDFMLLFRLLSTKQNQKEKVEWVQFSKYKVRADFSKGFVSLDQIQNLDNSSQFSLNLKPNQLQYVSFQEIEKEKMALDDSLLATHAPKRAHVSKEANNERCSYCNYITQEIEHLSCSNCPKVYHEQCLQKDYQVCLGLRESVWRCPDCIRCTSCLSMKNNTGMLGCLKCNSSYHFDCLDQSVKLSVPSLGLVDKEQGVISTKIQVPKNLNELDYKCESCVVCEHCGAKEAGKNRLNKWSRDFKLCSNCNKKRKSKQYCPICEQFWPELDKDKLEQSKYIPCVTCNMVVHTECDRMFEQEGLREKFENLKLQYNCPPCRQLTRTQLVVQLVERLTNEDKLYYFQEPVEEHVPGYTKIVKVPMCFNYIRQKISTVYLRNPEQLRADCALVFNNAMLFNLPKTKVHKEAQRLNEICSQIILSVWNTLDKNKLRTLDEDKHTHITRKNVHNSKKHNAIKMSGNEDYQFKSVEELFEISEHMPLQLKPQLPEYEMEISDYNEEERELFENGGVSLQGDGSKSTALGGGISKNLRTRKQINYNEDKLVQNATDALTLAGQKRQIRSQPSGIDEDQQYFGKTAKRPRNDVDFQSPYQPFKNLSSLHSASDLLQAAIQSQKQQASSDQQSQEVVNPVEIGQKQHVQQQQQMMMNYYQEIDDEKCYYSNPTKCSFDDPTLIFEEMCYLCGAFGNREDFLCCTLCGESFHTFCLSLPHDDISKFQPYWKCLNCKFCEVCASATQEAFLLYCDVCDKAFHSFCLKPKLKVIPNCGWKCQECFNCVKCSTKSFFSESDAEQQKNLEITDFRFSNNFSFCYQCGINEYNKSFCKICNKQSDLKLTEQSSEIKKRPMVLSEKGQKTKSKALDDPMLKCSVCGYYSHLKCSRVIPGTLQELDIDVDAINNGEQQNCYKCLDCLLSGKTINHLIRETCEHYENIHQIISRQKLISQVCQEVLFKYFPLQEKAPLFIKSFVDQNQDFFRKDPVINDWLNLLETNVCFESDQLATDIANSQDQEEKKDDADMDIIDEEKSKDDDRKREFWEKVNIREIRSISYEKQAESNSIINTNVQLANINEDNNESLKDIYNIVVGKNGAEYISSLSNNNLDLTEQTIVISTVGMRSDPRQQITPIQYTQILSKSKELISKYRSKAVQYKHWDISFNDVFPNQNTEAKEQNQALTKKDKVEQALFAHKEGFLPTKRNLYKSLYYGDLSRYGQKELFMKPEELELLITVPTEENLSKINFAELFVKYELKAVMKIKLQFFKWFEDLIKSIIKNNQKFLRKERKRQQAKQEEYSKNSADDTQMANNDQLEQDNFKQLAIDDSKDIMNKDEDTIVRNPQVKLQCCMCKLNGELKVTGRLIPYQINQFVHVNCAYWSSDVYETEDGQIVNFFFVQGGKSRTTKCLVCGENGASIFCYTRKCHNAFHFPCAFRHQKMAFLRNKETYCDQCSRQRGIQVGFLAEFSTNRRLYIVKNHQPWQATYFISQVVPQTSYNQQLGQAGAVSGADQDKPFQIEKWRPFYYDMFNRVGNLTVLSLRREINQIIEDSTISKSFLQGNQQSPVQNSLNDFSTMRIYWKFYKDQQLLVEDDNSSAPIQLNKTYFLYCNNQIKEIQKNDYESIVQYSSDKLKDKVQIGLKMFDNIIIDESITHNQTNFWTKIMAHFQKERPNFSLQNIEFSIQEFAGKTKYPISIWNRAEIKNKQFFLKSGAQVLAAQNITDRESANNANQSKKNEGMSHEDIFKNMMKINQMGENQNPMSSLKRYTSSKHMKYEQLLENLGKKLLFLKNPNANDKANQQNKNDPSRINKKLRTTDTIDTNKEVDLPIAMKYRLSKTQPKRVEVGPSKIHRNGLFVLEDLMPGDIVIEYVGEKIRNKVADKREIVYEQNGVGDCYLFRLDKEYIIDATYNGNKARYLNHSCDANCSAKIINAQGQKHIIISANRPIKANDELTYNYNFETETDKIECYCGAPGCLGRLN